MASSPKNALLIRRLYRSILQAAKPFTAPSKDAAVLSSLLHRTGVNYSRDHWDRMTLGSVQAPLEDDTPLPTDLARDLSRSYTELKEAQRGMTNFVDPNTDGDTDDETEPPHHHLFRWLLQELVAGGSPEEDSFSNAQMQFPSHIDTNRLHEIIRREFRFDVGSMSPRFDEKTRRHVAFSVIHALNDKISFAESLGMLHQSNTNGKSRKVRNAQQRARGVSPLPLDPSEYLKAGCYLVAHPLLSGFFRRTVICLLEHTESEKGNGGTYGLIVNRLGPNKESGWALEDVIRTDCLPTKLIQAFGKSKVREGGPVHVSLQMVHTCGPEQDADLGVGGSVLPILRDSNDEVTSTAIDSDRAVYFRGNVEQAADAVIAGDIKEEDVTFYVGASCWAPGQLQGEIERGFWYPVRAPPEMLLKPATGDLWLSMMCAIGEEEANLTHFFLGEDESNLSCDACDDFAHS